MQVFPGNYFNTKLRIRFLGSILMFLEFARLRQACGDHCFFFNTKFCLAISFIPHVFLAWTDRNCPKENRDFWTHNFPRKRETVHPIHVVCIANIYSLNSVWSHIFLFDIRLGRRPSEFTAILMFEFWQEATAASVPGFLCQSGRHRPENVSILSSLMI